MTDPLPSPHSPWFAVLLGSLGGVFAAGGILLAAGGRLTQLDTATGDIADIRANGTRVTQADHALIEANVRRVEVLEDARLRGDVADQQFRGDLLQLNGKVVVLFGFKDETENRWRLAVIDRLSRAETLAQFGACRLP